MFFKNFKVNGGTIFSMNEYQNKNKDYFDLMINNDN
jgi:hypothetical protein